MYLQKNEKSNVPRLLEFLYKSFFLTGKINKKGFCENAEFQLSFGNFIFLGKYTKKKLS